MRAGFVEISEGSKVSQI